MADIVPDEPNMVQTGIVDLPDDLHDLWLRYLKQEARGVRKVALRTLRQFTAALRAVDPSLRNRWAQEFLRQKLEEGQNIPLRNPLFEEVLFPLLADGYRSGDCRAAKWLAQLAQVLIHARSCWQALGCPSDAELWREAYRRNSDDEEARKGLIDVIASYVRHTLHELPAGVLLGMNGATPDECIALQDGLGEFRSLIRESERDRYADLITNAEFHYQAYRDYALERARYESYAHFLAIRGGR